MECFHPQMPDFLRLPLLQHFFVLVHTPHLPQVDASTWTDVQSLARLIARVRLLVSCASPASASVISTDLSLSLSATATRSAWTQWTAAQTSSQCGSRHAM